MAAQPPAIPVDAANRGAIAVKRARELLTPFAEKGSQEPLSWSEKKAIFDSTGKLGGPEGIGVLLRIAAIELSGDTITPDAFAKLQAAGEDAMDTIQNLMLKYVISNARCPRFSHPLPLCLMEQWLESQLDGAALALPHHLRDAGRDT